MKRPHRQRTASIQLSSENLNMMSDRYEFSKSMNNELLENGATMRQFIDFVAEHLQPPGLYDHSGRKRPKELKKKEAIELLETFQNMAIDVLDKIDNPKWDKIFIQ